VTFLLGNKIKTLRKQKGLSLEKLGELTETSKSYIWELENRNSCNPTADKLAKISQALGVTTDYLTNDNAELSGDVMQEAFFRKFNALTESDKKKIEQIIDLWSKKE
jgi:transcriptional regulator with XRE-family HTH domain